MFGLDVIAASVLYLVVPAVVGLIGAASLFHQYVLRIGAEDGFVTFRCARNLARDSLRQ